MLILTPATERGKIARQYPPAGLSADQAEAEIREALESIGALVRSARPETGITVAASSPVKLIITWDGGEILKATSKPHSELAFAFDGSGTLVFTATVATRQRFANYGALGGTRTPTVLPTATSRQRVYQFRHER